MENKTLTNYADAVGSIFAIYDKYVSILEALEFQIEGLHHVIATTEYDEDQYKQLALYTSDFNKLTNIIMLAQDSMALSEFIEEEEEYRTEVNYSEFLNGANRVIGLAHFYQVAKVLTAPEDNLHAIVSIHAGSGGVEAEDWAGMLFRMYSHWCNKSDRQFDVVSAVHSMEAVSGFKKVDLIIKGELAYGYLKSETGVHRLVRKSPFDKNQRRHTSFTSVKVTPLLDKTITININKNDVRVDTMRGSGAGGQHRNKTDSAVRLTHIPTGITAFCQSGRSQHANRASAWDILHSRIYEHEKSQQAEQAPIVQELDISWGNQIRSYTLHPEQRVKDHRCNVTINNFDHVLSGNINEFLIANIK